MDYKMEETYIHINMAINVCEYERGGKCVYKLTHAYAWITKWKCIRKRRIRVWARL